MGLNMVASLVHWVIQVYSLIVIVDAVLSWVILASYNPTVRGIYSTTNRLVAPLLNPIRRLIYPMTRRLGIDISPLLAIILLRIIDQILMNLLR